MRKEILLFLLSLSFSIFLSSTVCGANKTFVSVSEALTDTSLVNLPDTVYLQTTECQRLTELCLDIPANDLATNYLVYSNDVSFYANGFSGCNIDTVYSYNYLQLVSADNGDPIVGPYDVSWAIGDSTYTGQGYMTVEDIVVAMNEWDTIGVWTLDELTKRIRGGEAHVEYGPIEVNIGQLGVAVSLNTNSQFDINGTNLFFEVGLTKITIQSQLDPSCVDEFHVSVACVQTEEMMIDTLFPGVSDTICLDFSDLAGDVVSVENICTADGQVTYNLVNNNTCLELTTVSPGVDSACIVACNANGICDTTRIIVDVQDPNPARTTYTEDQVSAGQLGVYCIDTSLLTSVDTVFSLCERSNEYVLFSLDSANWCISYVGLQNGGADTFCLVTCDAMLSCDTNYIYVTSERMGAGLLQDTMVVNKSKTLCDFPGLLLPGNITQIENICADNTTEPASLLINTDGDCLDIITSGVAGRDTACLRFTDDMGNQDSLIYVLDVIEPMSSIITVEVPLSDTVEVCLDIAELNDVLDTIYICEDLTGDAINYTIDDSRLCLEAVGLSLNQSDTLCLAVCDEFSVCDTTTYYFNVVPEPITDLPVLANDTVPATPGETIQIDVCTNDSIPGSIMNFFVLSPDAGGVGPNNGIAFRDVSDCIITYIANADTCGVDMFTYVTVNEFGADTANVTILINCGGDPSDIVTVYNAFSPNKDGVNDYFTVEGLEAFPNHTLRVFNRWGNKVYEAKEYDGTWNGDWEGVTLPDGVYFYLIDTGEGQVVDGTVYIRR